MIRSVTYWRNGRQEVATLETCAAGCHALLVIKDAAFGIIRRQTVGTKAIKSFERIWSRHKHM